MKIPVGISSCLTGEKVRFDGGHKRNSYVIETLGNYFDFQSFCPEVAIGMSIPRKPIRLMKKDNKVIKCVSVDDASKDFTEDLLACAEQQRPWHEQICGYILKRSSPSCGMERVKVWGEVMPTHDGTGIYTGKLMANFPNLPVEEEGRLGDAVLRENFIQRVFVFWRWKKMIETDFDISSLSTFHARHKLIIMSHAQQSVRKLGQLVANSNNEAIEKTANSYLNTLMSTLKLRATVGNHVNVLQHIQGYLKNHLDKDDKKELSQTIENYYKQQVPLIVPITLLNHYFRKYPSTFIQDSWYMHPYPEEMSLQNSI